MRRLTRAACALALLLAPACSLLLDFDDLQEGEEKPLSGDAGASCPETCDDRQPCTRDSCDRTSSPPRCKYEPIRGVVDDGFSAEVQADSIHRVTITSAADAFYFTVFETTNGANELTLYRIRNASSEHEKLASFSGLLGMLKPRSAAGLVADTSDTSVGLVLHGFFALDDDVYHIKFNGDFDPRAAPLTTLATNTYNSGDPRRYPVAGSIGGDIVGAWINKDGTITAGIPDKPSIALGAAGLAATQLALIGSLDTPGVLWTGPAGVYSQLAGAQPSQLTDCEPRPGLYVSAMSVPILSGFWLTSWTKAGVGDGELFVTSQDRGIGCRTPLCVADRRCGANSMKPSVRNPAAAAASRSGDASGTVFAASANPYVRAGDAGTPEAGINLVVARIQFGDAPFEVEPVTDAIGTVELSTMPAVAPAYAGPDWPAVSILPPDRLAVAWIEPTQTGQVLKAKRMLICAP